MDTNLPGSNGNGHVPPNESLVFDIGANNGNDTAHYLARGFRVVTVEADPGLCQALCDRFRNELADGRVQLVQAAIADRTGSIDLWINDQHSDFSSIYEDVARKGSSTRRIQVPCLTFASLITRFGIPYYAKIDIEKADAHCLRDLRPDNRPRYISVEAHELDYLFLLHAAGYNAFKCADQMAHDDQRITRFPRIRRNWARLARRLGHYHFPPGSSGPISDQRVGPWLTLEQAAYEWLHYRFGFQLRTHLYCHSWIDFHATNLNP
jgi:FkbM family methyltransferase